MSKSKSPKKDSAPPIADPGNEYRDKARQAALGRSKKKQSFFDKYSYHIVFGVFFIIIGFSMFHVFWKSGPDIYKTQVNDSEYITQRNSMGNTFQVGSIPMFNSYKLVDVKNLINNQATNKQQLFKCSTGNKDTIVPQSYNFRNQYPQCARQIITQGNCSSSYSIAPISAATDRWCKLNNIQFPKLSPQTPIACDKAINNNCKSGFVSRTLDYAKIYGLVTQQCYPYASQLQTPQQCQKKTSQCQKFKIADYCVSSQQQNIKQQIFNHGPVVAVIPVYRDFLIYKKGLYQVYPKNQKFSSGHAIKIIGWDVIDGKNCWLVENTWGPQWGQNGVGCIMANQQELQTERFTIAVALNSQGIQKNQQVENEGQVNAQKQGQQNQQQHVQL